MKNIFLSLLLCIFISPLACSASELTDFTFFKQRPALLNLSTLSFSIDKSVKEPKRPKLGAFGIGGLNAFTLMGLSYPFNTYHNTTTYYHPFFADSYVAAEIGGHPASFPKENIWYIRNASVAVTMEENNDLSMATINFSPPGSGAFVRIVVLKPSTDLKDIYLYADIFDNKEYSGGEIVQTRIDYPTKRTLYIGSLDGKASISNGRLGASIESLAKNEEAVFYFYYIITSGDDSKEPALSHLKTETPKLLDETLTYWKNYLAGSTEFFTPDARLDDMIDSMKIALKIQRNANGAQVPVVKYADRAHDRENVHITRFYLNVGMPRDCSEIMMYNYYAAKKTGLIQNSQAADIDISGAPENVDWDHMPMDDFETTYNVAERPSWTILMFYWYYKQTGDLEYAKKTYPYLRRNLLAQQITSEGLLPFHGDDMGQVTYPAFVSGIPLRDMYSLDSEVAFVAAAAGMEDVALKLGFTDDAAKFRELRLKVEAAIYKYNWTDAGYFYTGLRKSDLSPIVKLFSLSGLAPAWIGYGFDSEKMKLNFETNAKKLGQKDGSIRMAAAAPLYHGQLQGLYLYNLKYFRHPLSEKLFHLIIDKVSDPAGQFSEAQENNHTHVSMSSDVTGRAKEDARRFGPWEGADDVLGLVYYLTGMDADADTMRVTLAPELPDGWSGWRFENEKINNNSFDLAVDDKLNTLTYTINNKGPKPVTFSLSLPVGKRTVDSITVNGQPVAMGDYKLTQSYGRNFVDGIERKTDGLLEIKVAYH